MHREDLLHPDRELCGLTAAGDTLAFRRLYDRYAKKVYAMALQYLSSSFEAQDMVQEVFAKVWEKRQALPELDNFQAWLIVITRNQLINVLRKKIPQETLDTVQQGVAGEQAGHSRDNLYEARELERLIGHAVASLSARQQEVYRMSRVEGLSHKAIARELNLSYDMVREHMSKALKNIRAFLQQQYGTMGLLAFLLLVT